MIEQTFVIDYAIDFLSYHKNVVALLDYYISCNMRFVISHVFFKKSSLLSSSSFLILEITLIYINFYADQS